MNLALDAVKYFKGGNPKKPRPVYKYLLTILSMVTFMVLIIVLIFFRSENPSNCIINVTQLWMSLVVGISIGMGFIISLWAWG